MRELKTVSTVDALAEQIEKDIFSLHYAPGARIMEADVCRRYSVSRNTVREAVMVLLSTGILCKVPNRGVSVKKITLPDVREIFRLRGLLEIEAARDITRAGVLPPELFRLAEAVVAERPMDDWPRYIDADLAFHEALVAASGSSRLVRLYQSISAEVKLCMVQAGHPVRVWNDESHLFILRAIESEDPEKAEKAIAEHMEAAIRGYEQTFAGRNPADEYQEEKSCPGSMF